MKTGTFNRNVLNILDKAKAELAKVDANSLGSNEIYELNQLRVSLDAFRENFKYVKYSIERVVSKTYENKMYRIRAWDGNNMWYVTRKLDAEYFDSAVELYFTSNKDRWIISKGGTKLNRLLDINHDLEAIEV